MRFEAKYIFIKLVAVYLKLRCNFPHTHVMNFIANLLAVKFITLFGSGDSPDVVQRWNAGRRSRNNSLGAASRERGIALITVMGLLILAAVLTASAITVSKLTAMISAVSSEYSESVYAAESAAARIQWYLIKSNPQAMPMLGETEQTGNDGFELDPLAKFRADGTPHEINSGGRISTVRIYDMKSGIDISGYSAIGELRLINSMLAQQQMENEDLTSFQDALLDYVDGDENIRLHGAERGEYEERKLPRLPRNSAIQFREEVMLIPGCEKLFQLDKNNRLSVFRIIAPPGLRSTAGRPSVFTAGRYQIMGRSGLSAESVDKVMEALQKWRTEGGKLSELLDPGIMSKLRGTFSFKESGLYTIEVKPNPVNPAHPTATLIFSCYISNVPEIRGTRYYQYFIF